MRRRLGARPEMGERRGGVRTTMQRKEEIFEKLLIKAIPNRKIHDCAFLHNENNQLIVALAICLGSLSDAFSNHLQHFLASFQGFPDFS